MAPGMDSAGGGAGFEQNRLGRERGPIRSGSMHNAAHVGCLWTCSALSMQRAVERCTPRLREGGVQRYGCRASTTLVTSFDGGGCAALCTSEPTLSPLRSPLFAVSVTHQNTRRTKDQLPGQLTRVSVFAVDLAAHEARVRSSRGGRRHAHGSERCERGDSRIAEVLVRHADPAPGLLVQVLHRRHAAGRGHGAEHRRRERRPRAREVRRATRGCRRRRPTPRRCRAPTRTATWRSTSTSRCRPLRRRPAAIR